MEVGIRKQQSNMYKKYALVGTGLTLLLREHSPTDEF